MTKRDVVRMVMEGKKPPYVPWSIGLTHEAWDKLKAYYGVSDLSSVLDDHIGWVNVPCKEWQKLPNDRVIDDFGVIWDRSVDSDIGVVENCLLPEPTLKGLTLPPIPYEGYKTIPAQIEKLGDCFRQYGIGFSLYERAWTLRGMENLMMDFVENPQFVHDLLDMICDHNIARVKEAVKYDIDCVYYGDDFGQQSGLQMGYPMWKEFIYPRLKRMYGAVRNAGKYVFIHSCGDVDELFDDLIGIGLNCFNPFQPEVMDVFALMEKYRGRLTFFGGLSTQKTLPYGSVEDVRNETRRLLAVGANGSYIFSPAHAVEGDVPAENMVAFLDVLKAQKR